MKRRQNLLGIGIYTIPEAARLTEVSAPRIRRWLRGYQFPTKKEVHESPPVWKPDLPELEGALALTFRDLLEVRFVEYFLHAGVSWKVLREAAVYAGQVVRSGHPFSTFKFKTDGKRIFADFIEERRRVVLELSARQYSMPPIVDPYLYEGIEFEGDNPARWFPMGRNRAVVIDPSVGFGQPTANPEGVPTAILANAFKVERSIERVARWYQVPESTVESAVEYERKLAA